MNKFLILYLSLLLTACTNHSDLQQEHKSIGEQLLSSGVKDYKQDHYLSAQQKFYRALLFYQSTDNSKGILLAKINLVEALIALSKFAEADELLVFFSQDDAFRNRAILLKVKLLFQQQLYSEALFSLQPLLSQDVGYKKIGLLATAARLETLIIENTAQQWLSKFKDALLVSRNGQQKYQIILKRIEAVIATQNKQYQEAIQLLNEALVFYKQQQDRRAIAACLTEIAAIEIAQNHKAEAVQYLNRALTVRVWLKDQYQVERIKNTILEITK